MTDKELHAMVLKHNEALFGDGNGNPGMVKMMAEMHGYVMGGVSYFKITLKIILIVGSIAAALAGVMAFLKGWRPE